MKISVVCKTKEWQIERLKEEALKNAVSLEVIDFTSPEDSLDNLGDIVIWRSSSLGGGEARRKIMNTIMQKSFLINRCLAKIPQATEKYFQQQYIRENAPSINYIPTFQFKTKEAIQSAIHNGILHFPFILKPNKGSKGEGVLLIENIDMLNEVERPLPEMVFQNFIKNSGDYRVFILGGRALGAIKRTASDGNFLNNVSKGGSAEAVTDVRLMSALRKIGTTVASTFELTLCGVDIIYDDITKKFFFLEVNTVPQWKGFQGATGINVAEELIHFCERIACRGEQETITLVRDEYLSQIHLLREKKFHLLSRYYLWTKDPAYRSMLDEIKPAYIGDTVSTHEKILRELLFVCHPHRNGMIAKEARAKYFKKYPVLEPYLDLLFKNLFAQKIYGVDLKPIINDLVRDADFLKLKTDIENDSDAIRALSTHAINYLYLLEFYQNGEAFSVSPEKLLTIGSTYPENTIELQIYFFTHCIIGASRFYSEKINPTDMQIYMKMLEKTEAIIQNNFEKISLDNKFEFLVCSRICDFHPAIENAILEEAARSLSPDGNFLIDTLNTKAATKERNDFIGAEHRNILAIMSQTPYQRA
jgi:RimK family alpha-L-glutamate ligase